MNRFLALFLVFSTSAFAGKSQSVIGSQHDLSPTGSGPVKSSVGSACAFCHAPHNVLGNVTPLWDHQLSTQSYTPYNSSTYNSGPQTPSGSSSKLCLSCHDGTVAVGLTASKGAIATTGSMAAIDNLGTNLSTGHPVGMTPANDGQLASSLFANPPVTKDPAVKLVGGKVECVTCHDPHEQNNDPAVPMFLARSNANGAMCLACHDTSLPRPSALSGWDSGAHASAGNSIASSVGAGPYGSVAANACSSCHGAHQNPAGARNLKGGEEAGCAPCHSGGNLTPALLNVMGDFAKSYRHPANTVSGIHDPAESLPVNNARHSECADCHNSHAAFSQGGTSLPPGIQPSLSGVSGYDSGAAINPAVREYQVCFKCHADSTNKVQNSAYIVYGRTPSRYPQGAMPAGYPVPPATPPDQYNVRLQFLSTIGHNVTGNSVATTSNTTLRAYMLNVDGTNNTSRPLTTTSLLFCSDCHNNDLARSANGLGANGPHGSAYPHILQRNLFQEAAGGSSGNSSAGYALCSKCHNLTAINNIGPHGPHMSYGCTTCHDPHGVIGGSPSSNRAMMNFDTAIVSASTAYFGYFYRGTGSGQRGCYLRCHSQGHGPYTY